MAEGETAKVVEAEEAAAACRCAHKTWPNHPSKSSLHEKRAPAPPNEEEEEEDHRSGSIGGEGRAEASKGKGENTFPVIHTKRSKKAFIPLCDVPPPATVRIGKQRVK